MANIIWTPPDGWVEESGAHVSFKAPCDCSAAGNLVIGSNSYSIVDAIGRTITGIGGAFVSGAVLDFILDCENLKAYLQNSAPVDYIVTQGKSGSWQYRKWSSGRVEAWYYGSFKFYEISGATGYCYSYSIDVPVPANIFNGSVPIANASISSRGSASYDRWNSASTSTNMRFIISSAVWYGANNGAEITIYAWTFI